MRLGAVEGGGSKFVCAVGTSFADIHRRTIIPTTTPAETLTRVADFLGDVDAIGVAMFGPLDLANGRTLRTPKKDWSDVPIRDLLSSHVGAGALAGRVIIETDVNAAALAEAREWGAQSIVYVTVGTGVGVGVVIDGRPLHGRMHPELGHLTPARYLGDDFAGSCPFHGACVEGLASAPAIRARSGRAPEDLPADDPDWDPVVHALAQLLATCSLAYAPENIVVGGGVMHASALLDRARKRLHEVLGGYLPWGRNEEEAQRYIVPPKLGDDAGLAGAFLLALGSAPP